MRIVQFANFYTPTSGGLRTCVEEIGRRYTDLGHDRVLIVPGNEDADERTPAGRRITLTSPPLPGTGDYRMLTARRRLLRLLDGIEPDVLEISDKLSVPWLAKWARPLGIPVTLFSHERLDRIVPDRLADHLNRRLGELADTVVVTSAFAAAEFTRAGLPNLRRAPLGVDLETFQPSPSQMSTVDSCTRLVMVSRLSREKNPGLAIDTLAHLVQGGHRASLTVVGDGPLRARLERGAQGLPVHFVGHVADRPAIARLVAAADVALAPCPAETFGLATLEALACGTPVVVPTAGALRELVADDASGRVCAPTPAGFATGVRALAALPRSVRREAARAAAERFPWSRTVDALLSVHAHTAPAPASP